MSKLYLKFSSAGFPGAQPVSMGRNNIGLLYGKKYMVSWKADGTRYLMYIKERGKIYMIDRDNSVFCVHNLTFPYRKDLNRHLENTLLDGVIKNNEIFFKILVQDLIKLTKLNYIEGICG